MDSRAWLHAIVPSQRVTRYALAERVQILGGVAIALGIDVSELSGIERARGREEVPVQISRLLEAHGHRQAGARRARGC